MSTYIFALGKHRNLSLAELYARYPKAKWEAVGDDYLIASLEVELDQHELNQLGGIIKVAKVLEKCSPINLTRLISLDLINRYSGKKLNYGVSLYGTSQKNLKKFLMELKKRLKKEDVKSRFINQDFKNVSTAQFKSLSGEDVEYLVVDSGQGIYFGPVVACQDIDAYTLRDFKKPFRDMQMGMLPPKLAQILINLTGNAKTIWDPFCGGGTLLIEALLMGRNVIGSDISEKHLAGAKKNIEWIRQFKEASGDAEVFLHDATKVKEGLKFDAIAAEGYLGPPQVKPLQMAEAENQIKHLAPLYIQFFEALKVAGYKAPVVIALPYFKLEGKKELDMREVASEIEKLGYEREPFLPDVPGIRDAYMLKYSRPDQYVGRAIYKLKLL